MQKLLAADPFGVIAQPAALSKFGSDPGVAIGKIIQLAIWILIIGAGIYALFNFVLAGYGFLSAEGDPKKIEGAWAKIWQSTLGLAVAAGSMVLAAIFGQLIFGSATAILNPIIPAI